MLAATRHMRAPDLNLSPARAPWMGAASIALAIGFNVPYGMLALTYDYPAILRRAPGEALDRFAAAGPDLILTWYAFTLSALLLAPLALGLALTRRGLADHPALAISAAIAGVLAGLSQAVGLARWVFVVPELARQYANPATDLPAMRAAEHSFDLLNRYGGMALGEYVGPILTALFVLLHSLRQGRDGQWLTLLIGVLSAVTLMVGAHAGLVAQLGYSAEFFIRATIAGFAGLTLWLILTGIGLLGRRGAPVSHHDRPPTA